MHALEPVHRVFLGEGLIETLYFKNDLIHYLEQHWLRMQQSATALRIPFAYDLATWRSLLYDALARNSLREGGLRCLLYAKEGARGLAQRAVDAGLVIQIFPYARECGQALHLWSVPWQRDNRNPVYQHKSIQYLEQIQALRQAQAAGFDDALFWDTDSHALETTTANIVAWDGARFYTPAMTQALIPGVFLEALREKLDVMRYELIYSSLSKTSLLGMNSVWVCNSLRGLSPVASLDGEIIAFDKAMHNRLLHEMHF